MNYLFDINPIIKNSKYVAIWGDGKSSQEIYAILINYNIRIDAICVENAIYDTLLGKELVSIMDLTQKESYSLIVEMSEYDNIVKMFENMNIDEKNIFVYINQSEDYIYV